MRLSSVTSTLTDVSGPEASTHRVEPSTGSVPNKAAAWPHPSLTVEMLFGGPLVFRALSDGRIPSTGVGQRVAVGAMGNLYCSSLLLYLHLDASRLRLFDSWNA